MVSSNNIASGTPPLEGTAMASTASKNKSSSSDASAESNTWNGRRDVVNIIFSSRIILFVLKEVKRDDMCVYAIGAQINSLLKNRCVFVCVCK